MSLLDLVMEERILQALLFGGLHSDLLRLVILQMILLLLLVMELGTCLALPGILLLLKGVQGNN